MSKSKRTTFEALRRTPLQQKVMRILRDAIMVGRLRPGERIVESRVAREMGVAQAVVREALVSLEHMGFVQKTPGVGTSVLNLTIENIKNIYAFRLELEVLALNWAKRRWGSQAVDRLQEVLEEMREAMRHRQYQHYHQLDIKFHQLIWELSDNVCLAHSLERHVTPLFAFFALWTPHHWLVHDAERHERIVKALEEKDGDDFEREIREIYSYLGEQGIRLAEKVMDRMHDEATGSSASPADRLSGLNPLSQS